MRKILFLKSMAALMKSYSRRAGRETVPVAQAACCGFLSSQLENCRKFVYTNDFILIHYYLEIPIA